MTPTGWTTLVLWGGMGVFLIWEIYTLANKHPGDHITSVVREAVRKHPFIGFATGVLMGHLFWP